MPISKESGKNVPIHKNHFLSYFDAILRKIGAEARK